MSVEAALRTLARDLLARVEEIVDDYVARVAAEVPEFFAADEPAVVEATRASAREGYRFAFEELGAARDVPDRAPPAATEEARAAADTDVPLEALLRTYAVGHATAWDHILAGVERLQLDPATRTTVLRLTSRYAFAYVERLNELASDEYRRARRLYAWSRDRRRARLVRDLLEGVAATEQDLGYPLAAVHVAAISWGARPDRALAALAELLSGTLLQVAGPLETQWGWVAVDDGRDPAAGLDRYAPPADTRVALGAPGRGRDGFRRSHEQAHAARAVALRTTEPVTRWHEVALEALVLHDERAARAFVREELGPLAAGDRRAAVLRQTLAAWFAAEHRAAGAAAVLGVHERTVSYRLRTIEQRLGHPIMARRTELEAALRLHDHCHLGG
jgi:PucR C-terminal helix-turn-helix domain/GGDEF-like domain